MATDRASLGSDPKLADPLLRNVLTTSAYGCPLGPTQAARHIRGMLAHELGATANPHFSIDKLNHAIVDVINAYLGLDLVKGGPPSPPTAPSSTP